MDPNTLARFETLVRELEAAVKTATTPSVDNMTLPIRDAAIILATHAFVRGFIEWMTANKPAQAIGLQTAIQQFAAEAAEAAGQGRN